jgi:xanthine dehydrogenase YagS FAD-binding subunit
MSIERFEWTNAGTVGQAVAHLGQGATLKAGGVDLMDLLKERLVRPSRLVNLRTVRGMDAIHDDAEKGLTLGPLVTLARLAAEPAIQRRYRALADAAGHAATPQIRNVATVGGNLLQRPRCWYFRNAAFHCKKKGGPVCFAQDGENAYHAISGNGLCAIVHPSSAAVALLALGATLDLTGAGGSVRQVPLEQFFVAPETDLLRENQLKQGEVITALRVPAPARGAASAYAKQGEKESFDWPLAEVAVMVERGPLGRCTQARVVLGAFAPVPHRSVAAERALMGQMIDERSAAAAARAALQGVTPLAQNAYKVPMFETVIQRTVLAAVRS